MSASEPEQEPNPYSAPTVARPIVSEDAPSSARTVELLRQTRPWVIFMSVIIFVCGGLMILVGVMMIGVGAVQGPRQVGMNNIGLIGFVVYVLIGLLYLVPAVYLMRYGRNITQYVTDQSIHSLNAALEAQKSFWRFVGMMTAVIMVLYFLIVVVMVLATSFAVMQ